MHTRYSIRSFIISVAVLILSIAALMGASSTLVQAQEPTPGQTSPPAIKLKSRTFTPPDGLDQALQVGIQAPVDGRIHVLLQMNHIPDDTERAALAAQGIELLDYIPDNAWLASMPVLQVGGQLLTNNSTLRWIGTLQATDKINPSIQTNGVGKWVQAEDGSVVLDVSFHSDVSSEAALTILAKHSGSVETAHPDFDHYVIRFPNADVINDLANEDLVVWIDNGPPPPTVENDGQRANTGVDTIQAQVPGLNGQGVVLGIWDGGKVDAHLDFTGRLTVVDNVAASSHATHVAGTMAGDGRHSSSAIPAGAAFQWRGVATASTIISYDFQGDTAGEHQGAINTYNIDLSQNSWGLDLKQANNNCTQIGDYNANSRAYDQVATGIYTKSMLILFAAGNSRDSLASDGSGCKLDGVATNSYYTNIGPISGAKNVVTVGATNSDDDSMTSFSDWGPMDDGRLKPDLVAPGCQLVGDQIYSTDLGSTYSSKCGTSMATPHVSGIAALAIQQYRTSYGGNALASSIKAVLLHTAKDMNDGSTFYNPGPDFASGYGRVDAVRAIQAIQNKRITEDQVANTETDTFTMQVVDITTPVTVTLVWDDAAAAANASPTLVNNLDLELVAPDGTTIHRPWILDHNNPANAATKGVDNINNVEQVVVAAPTAGTWTVRVKGTTVPQGPQKYSLVASLALSGPPPGNDLYANAIDVTAGLASTAVNLAAATQFETGEPTCDAFMPPEDTHSVWYKVTPAAAGQLTVNVTPGATVDPTLSIYTGSAVNSLTTVGACADVGGNGQAEAITNQAVAANTTYYIRVAAFNTNSGTANVTVTCTGCGAPEIQVLDGTTDVPDNTGSVNFGTTSVGTPVTKVFTVKNSGTVNLTLSGLTVPTGFSIAANFASATVAPNAQTTFSLKLDATAAGTPNGAVSFTTNDGDENPFNFIVSGTVSNENKVYLPTIIK